MKKNFLALATTLALVIFLPLSASAASWSYSNYNNGTYVPKSGTFTNKVGYNGTYGNIMTTETRFSLDSNNVTSILKYNIGVGDHENAAGINCYLTVDVTCFRNGLLDPFSAYSVATNLPDPKTDIENDDLTGSRNEESEAVALGTVQANKEYYMRTTWDDYRSSSSDSGRFEVMFAMSAKGISDYNNVVQAAQPQATINFGSTAGAYSADLSEPKLPTIEYTGIPATITFSKQLSASELEQYCTNYGIQLVQVQARGLDEIGDRITYTTLTTKGLTVTENLLKADAESNNINYKGFISAYVYIDDTSLYAAQNDSTTYSIELAEIAQPQNSLDEQMQDEKSGKIEFPHSRAWELENSRLGIS